MVDSLIRLIYYYSWGISGGLCLNEFKSMFRDYLERCCFRCDFSPSYKILQKLSPKHTAHGVAQSPYPMYRHGKACLSKQPPWRAAGDPRLARSRSRVRAPGPAGALRAFFSSTLTLPSFLLWEIVFFFRTLPTKPTKVLGLLYATGWVYYIRSGLLKCINK